MHFYIGSSGCQHPKNCSFCICTSLWPMWCIHRLRINIYTHLRKNKTGGKKKSWVRPEEKSVHACTTITLCCSRCLLGFICAQHRKCWSVSHQDIKAFLTGWRCPKSFPWIKINTLEYETELSAHALAFVVYWKVKQISF